MNATNIETLYTELANAIDRVGVEKAQIFLATLALSLISEHGDAAKVAELIAQAERLAKA